MRLRRGRVARRLHYAGVRHRRWYETCASRHMRSVMKSEQLREVSVPTFSSSAAPLASTALDRWALARIRQMIPTARVRFRLWDGVESLPLSTSATPLVG